jgi:hypothetical protein
MQLSDLKSYEVIGGASTGIPNKAIGVKAKSLKDRINNTANKITDFVGARGIADQYGATLAKSRLPDGQKQFVEEPGLRKVVGSAVQTGALLLPGAGAAKLAGKVAQGAATGYALDVGSKLQNEDKSIGQALTPGVGTALGSTLPIAGALLKPATKIVGRLFKGLGSGLSGVSSETIDKIVTNPKVAQQASEKLSKTGNNRVLEENAKQIVNGVSKVRQEARKSFGQGLETLSETDIAPKVFKEQTQSVLEKYGSVIKGGQRELTNVEFTDPKNIKKASELIDKLSSAKLDGKSLRKLSDDIENSAYKIATSDERLSFNAFINDLAGTLKGAVSASTPKLAEINKNFSQDMQLVEAVQNIFGKVNYKNLPEVVRASQKLEGMFAQKGLAPEVVDNFLERIGVSSKNFNTSEAVRQISNKASGSNAKGLSLGELTQQITSSVISPKMVRDLSIASGLAKDKLAPFLKFIKTVSPSARNALIDALISVNEKR